MGERQSKLVEAWMPTYTIRRPHLNLWCWRQLEQSLKNIVTGPPDLDKRSYPVPFTIFYDAFFSQISERDPQDPQTEPVAEIFEYSMEFISQFIINLLKLLIRLCRESVEASYSKAGVQKLKNTFSHIRKEVVHDKKRPMSPTQYARLGEALLYSVQHADFQMTPDTMKAWMRAYSVWLKIVVPAVLKRENVTKAPSSRRQAAISDPTTYKFVGLDGSEALKLRPAPATKVDAFMERPGAMPPSRKPESPSLQPSLRQRRHSFSVTPTGFEGEDDLRVAIDESIRMAREESVSRERGLSLANSPKLNPEESPPPPPPSFSAPPVPPAKLTVHPASAAAAAAAAAAAGNHSSLTQRSSPSGSRSTVSYAPSHAHRTPPTPPSSALRNLSPASSRVQVLTQNEPLRPPTPPRPVQVSSIDPWQDAPSVPPSLSPNDARVQSLVRQRAPVVPPLPATIKRKQGTDDQVHFAPMHTVTRGNKAGRAGSPSAFAFDLPLPPPPSEFPDDEEGPGPLPTGASAAESGAAGSGAVTQPLPKRSRRTKGRAFTTDVLPGPPPGSPAPKVAPDQVPPQPPPRIRLAAGLVVDSRAAAVDRVQGADRRAGRRASTLPRSTANPVSPPSHPENTLAAPGFPDYNAVAIPSGFWKYRQTDREDSMSYSLSVQTPGTDKQVAMIDDSVFERPEIDDDIWKQYETAGRPLTDEDPGDDEIINGAHLQITQSSASLPPASRSPPPVGAAASAAGAALSPAGSASSTALTRQSTASSLSPHSPHDTRIATGAGGVAVASGLRPGLVSSGPGGVGHRRVTSSASQSSNSSRRSGQWLCGNCCAKNDGGAVDCVLCNADRPVNVGAGGASQPGGITHVIRSSKASLHNSVRVDLRERRMNYDDIVMALGMDDPDWDDGDSEAGSGSTHSRIEGDYEDLRSDASSQFHAVRRPHQVAQIQQQQAAAAAAHSKKMREQKLQHQEQQRQLQQQQKQYSQYQQQQKQNQYAAHAQQQQHRASSVAAGGRAALPLPPPPQHPPQQQGGGGRGYSAHPLPPSRHHSYHESPRPSPQSQQKQKQHTPTHQQRQQPMPSPYVAPPGRASSSVAMSHHSHAHSHSHSAGVPGGTQVMFSQARGGGGAGGRPPQPRHEPMSPPQLHNRQLGHQQAAPHPMYGHPQQQHPHHQQQQPQPQQGSHPYSVESSSGPSPYVPHQGHSRSQFQSRVSHLPPPPHAPSSGMVMTHDPRMRQLPPQQQPPRQQQPSYPPQQPYPDQYRR